MLGHSTVYSFGPGRQCRYSGVSTVWSWQARAGEALAFFATCAKALFEPVQHGVFAVGDIRIDPFEFVWATATPGPGSYRRSCCACCYEASRRGQTGTAAAGDGRPARVAADYGRKSLGVLRGLLMEAEIG